MDGRSKDKPISQNTVWEDFFPLSLGQKVARWRAIAPLERLEQREVRGRGKGHLRATINQLINLGSESAASMVRGQVGAAAAAPPRATRGRWWSLFLPVAIGVVIVCDTRAPSPSP